MRTCPLHVAEGRIKRLTKRVKDLKTQQGPANIQKKDIANEAKVIQIQNLKKELDEANCRNGAHCEKLKQVEEVNYSELLHEEMKGDCKQKRGMVM